MARETNRQDRSSRQASDARSASGGRTGSGMSAGGERGGRTQAAGTRAGGAKQQSRDSARREPAGGQKESMSASGAGATAPREPKNAAGEQKGRSRGTEQMSASSGREQASPAPDREQAIRGGRETGASQAPGSTGLSARGGTSPVRGGGGAGTSIGGNPFLLMQRMAEDMDRLFEQFGFGRMGLGTLPAPGSLLGLEPWRGTSRVGRTEPALWSPQVEVRQRGDDIVIRADLPGVERDNVHVEVENDVLTIRGERREEHEEEQEGFYRSERSYGQFHRMLPLPEGVSADEVEATFKDGVLEITLPAPKQQEQRARRIEVR